MAANEQMEPPDPTDDPHLADPLAYPDAGGETGYHTPRWVKLFAIVVVVLALLFVILHLAGGGMGPWDHLRSGGAGGHAPPIERGVSPP